MFGRITPGTDDVAPAVGRAAVDAFRAAALGLDGAGEGAPGLRPQYAENYYGAYARDPDGNEPRAVRYAAA